ncbi:MAG: 4-(cytidine 5'-diphospho)-2-C-methyl-D-erythritol kinase [Myxococcota bacterium]
MKLLAPAKINLGLRVLGRRTDGYHELDSLLLPLDLADEIELELRPAARASVEIEVAGDAPEDASNLAVRAARAYLAARERPLAVSIRLRKLTPAAAGLGGGSSDAAAVLRGLHESQPGDITQPELAQLALELGADVPFFLDPRPSRVGGIGERVEPIAGLPSLALLLVNPGLPVPTAAVYQAFDAEEAPVGREPPPLPDFSRPEARDAALCELARNDLESPALRICPALAETRDALQAVGARAVGLSGSGGTFYGVFADLPEARSAETRLEISPDAWSRVARTLESR